MPKETPRETRRHERIALPQGMVELFQCRIKNRGVLDTGLGQQPLPNIADDHVARRAPHRRERQPHTNRSILQRDTIDNAEVHQVDRHLRVVDLGKRRPYPLLQAHRWTTNLLNLSWKRATISALRGPRARQRESTSSHVHGSLTSQRFASASKVQGNG